MDSYNTARGELPTEQKAGAWLAAAHKYVTEQNTLEEATLNSRNLQVAEDLACVSASFEDVLAMMYDSRQTVLAAGGENLDIQLATLPVIFPQTLQYLDTM